MGLLGMVEATIEDLAFLSRPQGKPAPPAGRECLSTECIKKSGTYLHLIVSNKCSDYTGGVPRPPMREVKIAKKIDQIFMNLI